MIVKCLLVYLASLAGLFLLGHVLASIVVRRNDTPIAQVVFRNVLVGYVFAITIQALISTHFNSVTIILLLISALFVIEGRISARGLQQEPASWNWSQPALLVGVAILFFAYACYSVLAPQTYLGLFYNQGDYVLYSRIAELIADTGQENGFAILNKLDPYYHGPEPYHFFDTWGAALMQSLFGINEYAALMLIIYPIFYFLVFVGLLSVFNSRGAVVFMACLLLCFLGGVSLGSGIHPFLQALSQISINLTSPLNYKLSYIYVFLLAAFLLFRGGQLPLAVLCLLALPVANIVTAPSIFPALFCLLLIGRVWKLTGSAAFYRNILYVGIVLIGFFVFFWINKRASAGLAGAEISEPGKLISDAFSVEGARTRFNIIASGALSIMLLYWPFLLALFLLRPKWPAKNLSVIFLVMTLCFALVAWALLYNETNSRQAFYNMAMPLLNTSLILAFIYFFLKRPAVARWRSITAVVIVCGFCCYNLVGNLTKTKGINNPLHSDRFLAEVDRVLSEGSIVASLKGPADMEAVNFKYNAVYPLGDFLMLYNKNVHAVNIGDLDTPIDSSSVMNLTRSKKAIRDGLFYRFAKREGNQELSKGELMTSFLTEFDMRYLLVSPQALTPAELYPHFRDSITDPLSGERFYVLKRKNVRP